MAKVIERIGAYYEVRGVEAVYGSHPESIAAECDGGERPTLTALSTNEVSRPGRVGPYHRRGRGRE